ncbi:pre-mRNA-processing factor 39-2 isoform X2 [Spinacia oleracea]|nr:pre-mRNA-processing factor 39-2 isoform X2 [Spinacia oleracea]
MKVQGNSRTEEQPEHDMDSEIMLSEDAEISHVISDLIDQSTRSKALQKYITVGEFFYQKSCDLDAKVQKFEQNIRRPYFHVKPLDDNQLRNWHRYLDLVEMEGDFDWGVKLYERCLISCAHYPDFWMRYVDYVESKGGREIATDALGRATQIFLKNMPEIHLFNAWFKEKIGDVDGALAAFPQCGQDNGSYFIETIRRKANMERRMGNHAVASSIYKEALDLSAKKRPDLLPMLYVHFAHLQYMITDSKEEAKEEAAREVLLNGIRRVPHSKLLIQELILFALRHDGARQVEFLDSVMGQTLGADVSGGLSNKEREDISILYLEFIDSCGSINDIRRAWNRHLKFFPHLVRGQSSLKKPDNKAGDMWKKVIEGRPDSVSSYPPKSPKKLDENDLIQLSPAETVVVSENIDNSEQAIREQTHFENGNRNPNDLSLVTSEVTKTFAEDECKANESGIGLLYQAVDDRNPAEVVKDSRSLGIQEEQEQDRKFQQQNPDSLGGHSFNPRDDEYQNRNASCSRGLEAPREAAQSNGSTPVGGDDTNEIPSTSCPISPRSNNAAVTCNESPCPSRMTCKDPSSVLSPDHPSDKEGNQHRFNSSGKSRSRLGSPADSGERLERSLSPRRRNSHGYLIDRRHRDRSLSPRRHNSRWNSDERWPRDRRHRRYPRYQDNSRGYRDGRVQNQNIVVIGNKGQTQNSQQQPTGSVSQTQLPVQHVGYPQPQTNQYMPINEQFGNLQNNQSYNQMMQYYYYNHHQQQLLLQQPLGSQQLQQMQPPEQLQQQIQNPAQQQLVQNPQQPQGLQQTLPHQQQLSILQYQQQQLYQQLQFQQQPTNEQPQSQQQHVQLQQQTQLPQQHVFLQQQQQPPEQQEQQVHIQQQQQQTQPQKQEEAYLQQQQQQSYQYQQAQQQQYLLYLQQLHQYQLSQQQPGLALDQKSFQQQYKLPEEQQKELSELLCMNEKSQIQKDDGSAEVTLISSPQQQDEGMKHGHGSTAGAPSQDELPEIDGTDI